MKFSIIYSKIEHFKGKNITELPLVDSKIR